jgi:hypothetical protein
MAVEAIKKAISKARKALKDELPAFFVVPKAKDEDFRTVALDDEMRTEMVAIAMTTLEHAADYEQVEYDPEHRIVRGEEVLLVTDDHVNDESEIYDIIERFDDLVDLDARELIETPTRLYGIAFGTTEEDRIVFVRRHRIDSFAADGKLIALAGDTLRAVKQPGLIIDRVFDLIVFPEGIVAFDSLTFERLIKNPEDVSAELLENAKEVAKVVPFAPDVFKALVERGETKPMIRRKLRSIVERGHLAGVTMAEIKAALKAEDRVPSQYIKRDNKDGKDKLNFDVKEALFVLGFLDEGTWLGWRSKTLYSASGRTVVK